MPALDRAYGLSGRKMGSRSDLEENPMNARAWNLAIGAIGWVAGIS